MAVIDGVRGVSVTIHRKDDDAEYNELRPEIAPYGVLTANEFDETFVTYMHKCYIHANATDEYYLRFRFSNDFVPSNVSIRVWIYVDGNFADALIANRRQIHRGCGLMRLSSGWRNGRKGTLKRFCFKNLKFTDDEDEADLDLPDPGTILIKMWEVQSTRRAINPPQNPNPRTADDGFIFETQHMRDEHITLATGVGNVESIRCMVHPVIERIPGRDQPFAVFKYYYRDTDALESMGINYRLTKEAPVKAPVPASQQQWDMENINSMTSEEISTALQAITADGRSDISESERLFLRE